MKYLLDTCTFLWFLEGSTSLSDKAREIIIEGEDVLGVGIVSLWEMSIKSSMGNLMLPGALQEMEKIVAQEDIELLPITVVTTRFLQTLPFHHNDPFDRTIIATSMEGAWAILTPDTVYDKYEVTRVW